MKKSITIFSILLMVCIISLGINIIKSSNEYTNKQAIESPASCLIVGIDNRQHIDAVMVAAINDNKMSIISIPRDIKNLKENYEQEIGADNLNEIKDDISDILEMDINNYIALDQDSVLSLFSEIETVDFEIPDLYKDGAGMVYDDDAQNLHIALSPGKHDLTAEEMMSVIRYIRGNIDEEGKYFTYDNGEIDRIRMQQELLKTIIKQKQKILSTTNILAIAKQLLNNLNTNLSGEDISDIYNLVCKIDYNDISFEILPGEYQSDNYENYFAPDKVAIKEIISDIK